MKTILKKVIGVAFILFCLTPLLNSASAHRVNIFAWVEGDTVFVESKFPGGRKVMGGKIIVVDSMGNELLNGVTNDQGEFSFQVPKPTDLKIILSAGEGHQAEWTITATDLAQTSTATAKESSPAKSASSETPRMTPGSSSPAEPGVTIPPVALQDLEALIEGILDKKLKPITKMLIDAQDRGPSLRDILGGIGYILGLAGIAAYVQSRKKKG
jgi:nickel transport protein